MRILFLAVNCSGSQEPLMTPYHYFIGCRNDIINNDDKLNECAALQRGVEVILPFSTVVTQNINFYTLNI